jgi:hypothetical protein
VIIRRGSFLLIQMPKCLWKFLMSFGNAKIARRTLQCGRPFYALTSSDYGKLR